MNILTLKSPQIWMDLICTLLFFFAHVVMLPALHSLHSIYLSNHTSLCLHIYSPSLFGMYRVFIMRGLWTCSQPPSLSLDIFPHYRSSALMRSSERLYHNEELNTDSLIDYVTHQQIAVSAHPDRRTQTRSLTLAPLSIFYYNASPHETVSHWLCPQH